ncbi:MAG: group III truncated hemoglobin [Ekhidna sp.]|nr:group III truncated hemoglobin [Ekhidna sp.]
MQDIESREDISKVVHAFYGIIRKDDLLGPIFNHHIEDERWPVHLSMLTDFWEMNLFGTGNFTGRPGMKHILVDRSLNEGMNGSHFRQWLELWFQTLDSMFQGPKVELAKDRALLMAKGQLNMVVRSRE